MFSSDYITHLNPQDGFDRKIYFQTCVSIFTLKRSLGKFMFINWYLQLNFSPDRTQKSRSLKNWPNLKKGSISLKMCIWGQILLCSTHRIGSKDLQAGFVRLQQLAHHFKKTFHKQVDALTVAGHQQLVQSFHGYAHVPKQEINHTTY